MICNYRWRFFSHNNRDNRWFFDHNRCFDFSRSLDNDKASSCSHRLWKNSSFFYRNNKSFQAQKSSSNKRRREDKRLSRKKITTRKRGRRHHFSRTRSKRSEFSRKNSHTNGEIFYHNQKIISSKRIDSTIDKKNYSKQNQENYCSFYSKHDYIINKRIIAALMGTQKYLVFIQKDFLL